MNISPIYLVSNEKVIVTVFIFFTFNIYLKKKTLTFLFFGLGVYKCNKVTHENIFFLVIIAIDFYLVLHYH